MSMNIRWIARPPTSVLTLLMLLIAVSGCATSRQTPGAAAANAPGVIGDSIEREHVVGVTGRRLDSLLTAFEQQGFAGTALIVQRGRIVLAKGYGFANRETRTRNSPATRFELNSFVKMFTAAAILQLAGDGVLRLDDPLERHLGTFPAAKRAATIEQLASHTAGIVPDGADVLGDPRDRFVDAVKAAPLESTPGTKYRYSNVGYSVLAALIERKTGMRYEDYLTQRVFAPAGMRSVRFRNDLPANDPLFAHGYGPADSAGPAGMNPYQWGTIGAGGVWSTMGDVFRWITAVERGTVIPRQYAHLLNTPPRPPSLEAFGWHVYAATDTTRARIEKGGGSPVFATQLLRYPADDTTILWASNDLTIRWRQALNRELPRILFGATR